MWRYKVKRYKHKDLSGLDFIDIIGSNDLMGSLVNYLSRFCHGRLYVTKYITHRRSRDKKTPYKY